MWWATAEPAQLINRTPAPKAPRPTLPSALLNGKKWIYGWIMMMKQWLNWTERSGRSRVRQLRIFLFGVLECMGRHVGYMNRWGSDEGQIGKWRGQTPSIPPGSKSTVVNPSLFIILHKFTLNQGKAFMSDDSFLSMIFHKNHQISSSLYWWQVMRMMCYDYAI